jgi:hypothetical protein
MAPGAGSRLRTVATTLRDQLDRFHEAAGDAE